jgi:hypothetical protein
MFKPVDPQQGVARLAERRLVVARHLFKIRIQNSNEKSI